MRPDRTPPRTRLFPLATPARRIACALALLVSWRAGVASAQASSPGAAAYAAGQAAAARRDWPAAAAAMEQAVREAPMRADYHYWLGRAYGQQARTGSLWTRTRLASRIFAAWERAIALDSTYDAAYAELIPTYAQVPAVFGGSTRRAEALLAQWLRIRPYQAGLARVGFDHARNLRQQAIADAEALAAAFPDSARPVAELAMAYQRASRAADAERVALRGLARWPDAPYLLYALGRGAASSGQELERGEVALRRVLAAATPDSPFAELRALAHVQLGRIGEHRGDRAIARGEYRSALAIEPTLRAAREGLERVR